MDPVLAGQLKLAASIISGAAAVIGGVVASTGLALIVGNGAGSFAAASSAADGGTGTGA